MAKKPIPEIITTGKSSDILDDIIDKMKKENTDDEDKMITHLSNGLMLLLASGNIDRMLHVLPSVSIVRGSFIHVNMIPTTFSCIVLEKRDSISLKELNRLPTITNTCGKLSLGQTIYKITESDLSVMAIKITPRPIVGFFDMTVLTVPKHKDHLTIAIKTLSGEI